MKKVFAIALIGGLILASCSKKETSTESNVMLPEPEVTITYSASVSKPATEPAKTDGTAVAPVKTDSATAK
jgi:hypothetical protein